MTLRIAYIPNSEMAALPLIEAVQGLPAAECGTIEVMVRCAVELQDPDSLEAFLAFASRAHIVIVHLMGGIESIPGYARLRSLIEDSGVHFHLVGTAEALSAETQPVSTLPEKEGQRLSAYVRQGGVANLRNLLLWLATLLDGAPDVADPPQELPWEGIYHPDEEGTLDPETYHRQRLLPNRPTIGLLFFRSYWAAGNLAHVDALIRGLEQAGANVLPVFTNGVPDVDLGARGAAAAIERYFLRDGQPQVDAVVSLLMLFSIGWGSQGPAVGDGAPNVLKRLGVPIIQAIANSQTEEEWRTGLQGLSPLDVSFSVAIPEFDGALITVPVACRVRRDIDPITGARIVRYQPVPERIAKLARLALNWARLRSLPNADKRVAIILHNYPPRDDTIGTAFGLDAPASVVNILRTLADEGYQTGAIPANGDALIAEIMERVTNDRRLLSAERARLAVDSVTPATYADWFETFGESVRKRLVTDWGTPPGDVFNYEGRLLIPGVLRGNVFIGLQPPRGFGEDASKIYHSPDATPTHHYLAYYRWLRDVFGAHVVLHIGKHGSLEWLPGKAVGLSAECFPDLAISDLPNIYPYIINNPSEGTQAKRRSYACLVDHLVPAMMRADSYGDLARIENLLQDYYHSRQLDPQKQPVLRNLIWEAVEEAHLQAELQIAARPAEEDWDAFLQRLHGYLSELGSAQVKDGLHTLGEPPSGERLVNMLFALTQLDNGDIPSLLRSVAEARGYDYDDLLANRGQLVPELLKTKGMILAEMEDVARGLIRALAERHFAREAVAEVAATSSARIMIAGRPPT